MGAEDRVGRRIQVRGGASRRHGEMTFSGAGAPAAEASLSKRTSQSSCGRGHRKFSEICRFRRHTPGWLLLAFSQFTFCTAETTLLMAEGTTIYGPPRNGVLWERRNSGGSSHSHGCGWERSGACDDDIEAFPPCSSFQKSGKAAFSAQRRGKPRPSAVLRRENP